MSMSTIVRIGRARSGARSSPATPPPRTRRYLTLHGATLVTVVAVALSALGLLYLVQTSHVASLGYELSRLQHRREEVVLEQARLRYELARHQSLDTVEQVARQDLGMRPLARYQFLDVQRPVDAELPVPPPPSLPAESLGERLWRALAGGGRAVAEGATAERATGGAR